MKSKMDKFSKLDLVVILTFILSSILLLPFQFDVEFIIFVQIVALAVSVFCFLTFDAGLIKFLLKCISQKLQN